MNLPTETASQETTRFRERTQFRVDEMDCAEEVLQLRQELEGRPGIGELEFDVLNGRMTVTYDPEATSVGEIVQQVANTGMHARPWSGEAGGRDKPVLQNRGRLIATCLSGGLLAAAFLSHWVLTGSLQAVLEGATAAQPLGLPWPALALYVLSILIGLRYVVPRAWSALRRLRPDMNLLMSLAVVGAVILGEWFEAATVTFLFALALLLEQWSLGRVRRAVETLLKLSPETAHCRTPEGEIVDRRVEDVAVGTRVVVRPGEKLPVDGIVREGNSSVDEAPITGESAHVAKEEESEVFAGTINGEGVLEVEVTRPADDTTLARIVHMVEEAQSRQAPTEQWVEVFARYYTPAMMALALAIAVLPPLLFGSAWVDSVYRGLVVLVIACPCALVISTPVSIVSALTSAARHGILVKGGRFLEAFAHLRALALDKTGTLTGGRPEVQDVVPFDGRSAEGLLRSAAALEFHSRHPLARAVLRRAEQEGIAVEPAGDYRVLNGRGAEGTVAGRSCWIGGRRMVEERLDEASDILERMAAMEDAGHSALAVGEGERVQGLIGIADTVRENMAGTIRALREAGIQQIVMLTGDNRPTARSVAETTGVDEYRAELLPDDKLREVESLRERYRSVGMIGDGVNDAPAMAASTLGIAMGAIGTDTAIETADVALMSDDLSRLPWLIGHARRTLSIIRQNIAFALGLKFLFIALTIFAPGLEGLLWIAIAADTGASLLVIFNGMRLLKA